MLPPSYFSYFTHNLNNWLVYSFQRHFGYATSGGNVYEVAIWCGDATVILYVIISAREIQFNFSPCSMSRTRKWLRKRQRWKVTTLLLSKPLYKNHTLHVWLLILASSNESKSYNNYKKNRPLILHLTLRQNLQSSRLLRNRFKWHKANDMNYCFLSWHWTIPYISLKMD